MEQSVAPQAWRDEFYALFEIKRSISGLTYDDVYTSLSQRVRQEEKSFASKMYHTINNDSPIIDQQVLSKLKIPNRSKKGMALTIYNDLRDAYCKNGGLIDDAKRDQLANQFDSLCIQHGIDASDLSQISLVKKIDFYLWAM